jgi:SAM-dependent methyltransferase
MSLQMWESRYKSRGTIRRNAPTIFGSDVIGYFPQSGTILDLGAGSGRDTRFFATQGYQIVSADIADSAHRLSIRNNPANLKERIEFVSLDMRVGLPFHDKSFDVVYAHLSLHYFNQLTTSHIIDEVYRILRINGIFAFLVNSVNDPDYGTGTLIERDLYLIKEEDGEGPKRYFSVKSTGLFVDKFKSVILDNQGEADFKSERGIHNLIRFVGKKI